MTAAVLIVDFGSQVTQLIARRVRELGVYCEIHPFSAAAAAFQMLQPQAIVLSGGPASVLDADSPRAPANLFDSGVPILAICYGQQTTAVQLGGRVEGGHAAEFGRADVVVSQPSALFDGVWSVGGRYPVWMSHGDRVVEMPRGFEVKATSEKAPFAVATDETRRIYTTMFHPEVVHTPDGARLIENFVRRIAGLSPEWTMTAYRDQMVERIRAQVGRGRVICGLSGGVDSAVAAKLIHDAVGDQLTCILVDHGLLRANEARDVVSLFRDSFNIPLRSVDASEAFLAALADVTDPEQKRKVIGRLFIETFEAEALRLGDVTFLAQGTLYPDVIESVPVAGGPAVTIKSHHNVGGLPERMKLVLVEPLRELFKDEVRILGRELGLPEAFIGRHPFPGPGLAIRIPGTVTRDKLETLRHADSICLDEIRKAGLYDEIWQAFVVLLPVKTVGVMGDGRTYENVAALRAVTSSDGMTADYFPMPHATLGRIATRIINEVRGINRVVYDITSKPPARSSGNDPVAFWHLLRAIEENTDQFDGTTS
jgi:GMP synthase (glutamine-hydrolysing)